MTTAVFTHPSCLLHEMGPGHPENPLRLQSVLDALRTPEFEAVVWREAPEAPLDAVDRVHDPRYVRTLLAAVPEGGYVRIDPDTAMSPASG